MIKELIPKNRSYRRFHQDRAVTMDTLRELIDLARLAPSGYNRQGLKYLLSNSRDLGSRHTGLFLVSAPFRYRIASVYHKGGNI